MKNSFLLFLSMTVCLLASSCNTFIGMGKDFQSLGNGMVNTAHGKPWSGENPPAQSAPQQQTTVPMP